MITIRFGIAKLAYKSCGGWLKEIIPFLVEAAIPEAFEKNTTSAPIRVCSKIQICASESDGE